MVKITEEFKAANRENLTYENTRAERIMKKLTGGENCTLLEVWPHTYLPERKQKYDPEIMTAMIKGHDNHKDNDFYVLLFGKWEDLGDMFMVYVPLLWEGYKTDTGSNDLPKLYFVSFEENPGSNEEIREWNFTFFDDKGEALKPTNEKMEILIVNTSVDSMLMDLLLKSSDI